ncbi:9241_t:CDS:2, partial [Dentiscutata erythropus]
SKMNVDVDSILSELLRSTPVNVSVTPRPYGLSSDLKPQILEQSFITLVTPVIQDTQDTTLMLEGPSSSMMLSALSNVMSNPTQPPSPYPSSISVSTNEHSGGRPDF